MHMHGFSHGFSYRLGWERVRSTMPLIMLRDDLFVLSGRSTSCVNLFSMGLVYAV
jgi:hypothetical protein